ncbi:hypothetical protein GCM10009753_21900 [Streptantibioticus ferralitis]
MFDPATGEGPTSVPERDDQLDRPLHGDRGDQDAEPRNTGHGHHRGGTIAERSPGPIAISSPSPPNAGDVRPSKRGSRHATAAIGGMEYLVTKGEGANSGLRRSYCVLRGWDVPRRAPGVSRRRGTPGAFSHGPTP